MTIIEQRGGVGHDRLGELMDLVVARVAGHVIPGTGRRYELLHADTDSEAWLIAWPNGTGLAMHDHRGSSALIHVVSGELRERHPAGDGFTTRSLVAGERYALAADHVHEVLNIEAPEAVSIHFYSPRLGDLGFHEDGDVGHEILDRA